MTLVCTGLSSDPTVGFILLLAMQPARYRPYNALALRGGNDFQKQAGAALARYAAEAR